MGKYDNFINATEFIYKFTFQNNIEDASKEVPALTLEQLNATEFKHKDALYSITLGAIQFDRKVYEPGQITTELLFALKNGSDGKGTVMALDDLKTILLQRMVTLSVRPKDSTEEVTLAQNYYVHEISPQVRRDTNVAQLFVKLTIYSIDKLMTLNKYSRAYVCQKLGTDILASEIRRFGFKQTYLTAFFSNQQHLVYKFNGAKTEFLQPYLVQYNESFYDFMKRTANRCGEFFFFEDGRLVLGMPEDEKNETINITKYASVTYQNVTQAPLTITAFSRDSAKDSKQLEFNDTPTPSASTGYPEGIFDGKLHYNTSLAHDDYIFPLVKDKWTTFMRELGLSNGKAALTKLTLDVFAAVASNVSETTEGAKAIASNLAGTYAKGMFGAKIDSMTKTQKQNETWIDNWKGKKEQCDGARTVQFSSLSEEGWLKLSYYSKTRQQQESLQQRIVCIDMGTHFVPVKLGGLVTIDGISGKYIVIQVSQSASSKSASHSYEKYADKDYAQAISGQQSQKIYAIPVLTEGQEEIMMPPMIDAPVIREAKPQTAFVVENKDPKNQGRVRIAYPWQTVAETETGKSLDTAKKTLDKVKEDNKKATGELQKAENLFNLLKSHDKQLQDLQDKFQKAGGDAAKEREILNAQSKANDDAQAKNNAEIQKLEAKLDKSKKDSIPARIEFNKKLIKGVSYVPLASIEMVASYKDTIDKLTQEQVATEEKLAQLRADNEMRKTLGETLKSYASQGELPPSQFFKKKQEDKQPEIKEALKKKIEATRKQEQTQSAEQVAAADVSHLSAKWKDELTAIASPWVRVAMPMATFEGGMFFRPGVGDEVLVNYDCGNVERPYVSGSLYSKEHNNPKGDMVIQSPSGQKITFNVAKTGTDFISGMSPFFKTLQTLVPPLNADSKLGGDARKLAGGITLSDEFGMFKIAMSSADRSIKIASPFGNVGINAFSGITISAPNGDVAITGKNVTITAGNNLTLLSGSNVNDVNTPPKKEPEDGPALLKRKPGFWGKVWKKAKAGATWVGEYAVGGAQAGIETSLESLGGLTAGFAVADMKLVRCLCDVFLRPIEGTMCIKSKNFLMLEAGRGKAQVNVERYNAKWQKIKGYESDADRQKFFAVAVGYVDDISTKVEKFCRDYDVLKKNVLLLKKEYEEKLAYVWDPAVQDKPEPMKAAFKLGDNAFKKNDDNYAGGTVDMAVFKQENIKGHLAHPLLIPDEEPITTAEGVKAYILPAIEAYAEAVALLQKHTRTLSTVFSDQTLKDVTMAAFGRETEAATTWVDTVFKTEVYHGDNCVTKEVQKKWEDRFGAKGEDPKAPFLGKDYAKDKHDIFTKPMYIKRKIIATFLLGLYNAPANIIQPEVGAVGAAVEVAQGNLPVPAPGKFIKVNYRKEDITDDFLLDEWYKVAALGAENPKKAGFLSKAADFLDKYTGTSKAWKPVIDPDKPYLGWDRQVWAEQSGKIIFSDTKNTTYGFNGENIEKWSMAGLNNEKSLKKALEGV